MKVYSYVILILLTFIGCVNKDELAVENLDNGNHSLKVQVEPNVNSRTMVDEINRVCWINGDQIGVFGNDGLINIPFLFSNMADDGLSAIFKGNLTKGGLSSVAYYPYDDKAVLEGEKLSFVLPSEYDYTKNSNAPMIGVKQEDESFMFKHLCGLLKFSIENIPDDAEQVIITAKGEKAPPLAGTCIVENVNENEAILSIPDGSSKLTIKMNGMVGTQTFYIPVPVGIYSELQVVLEKEDGTSFFSEKLSNITIRRATIFHVTKDLAEADKSLDEFVQTSVNMSSDEFLSGLIQLLKNNKSISGYDLNINGCEITYQDGSVLLLSFVYTGNPFGMTTEPAPIEEMPTYDWIADVSKFDDFTLVSSTETRASSEDNIYHNMNILRWAPYQDELGIGWDFQRLLEKSPLKLNIIGNYVNQDATSSRLMDNLSQAGIIDIESHGSGGKYIFIPVHLIDRGIYGTAACKTIYFSKKDVVRIDSLAHQVGIPVAAFERYSYVKSGIIFNNSCESAKDLHRSLKDVFTEKGISTYTGYSDIVFTSTVQEKMNWYTNSLLCDLKSNVKSKPVDCSYDGERLEIKEEGGKVKSKFIPESCIFEVINQKEMQFVEFGPQGSVEISETDIYLPFQFKGAENLKNVCQFGVLMSNRNEIEEEITEFNIGNYAVGKTFSISEMEGRTNCRFKASKDELVNALSHTNVGNSETIYYWIYLEYKGRYYISDQCGSFTFERDRVREFLISLYNSTDGDHWLHNNNWCSSQPIETWFGITKSGDMYSIDLQNNNLHNFFGVDCDDLSGAELNFEHINLSGNHLLGIYVPGFRNMKSLDCSGNQELVEVVAQFLDNISSIDVSDCPKLEYFAMEDCNTLQILKVSNCVSLKEVTSYDLYWQTTTNNLTYVDFSGCTSLIGYSEVSDNNESWHSFDFSYHALEYANFENCSSMTGELDVASSRNLTYVNVSGCSALNSLDCSSCLLKELYVSGCMALEKIRCDRNVLNRLDLSGCTSLKELDCSKNALIDIDVANRMNLSILLCESNPLISINASNCSSLKKISFDAADRGGVLRRLDLSGCSALRSIPRFKMKTLTYLDLSNCSSLDVVICDKNALEVLKVSGCSALKRIFCSENALTSLDLSGCSSLVVVDCHNNHLKKLDVSSCVSLYSLNCSNNSLTNLYLNNCTKINDLTCSSNYLTGLDLSRCSHLRSLTCKDNKISSEIPLYLLGVDLHLDYRYEYYYEDGEFKYRDNTIGWWYPGEPESGKHEWYDVNIQQTPYFSF